MIDRKQGNEGKIRRFSYYRIGEHWVHIILFLILVMTGLSQKFYLLEISQWFILKLGGIDNARVIHRYTGIVLLMMLVIHIMTAMFGIVSRKWQLSMVITRKDITDLICNIQYYIGIKDQAAFCDRYNYKQKFEYWGILLGVVVMVITGLMLWFPSFITQFLPGETVPVAKVLHSNQALVILLIIAIWHVYNAIFSPEVFPLDTSIFTGYISKERMIREHPLELLRIENRNREDVLESSGSEYSIHA